MNINTFYNASELAAYHNVIKTARQPFIGESLFPVVRTTDISISWVKGYKSKNIVLKPSAFDTNAIIRSKTPAKKIEVEMPFFKESFMFNEEERRSLINNLKNYGDTIAEQLAVPLYYDYGQMVDGSNVQLERMIMSLLVFGQFTIESAPEDGTNVLYSYNYDPSGEWIANNNTVILGTSQWTAANAATSDPIGDLVSAIQDNRTKNGAITAKMLMNTETYRGIMASDSIKKAVSPLGGYIKESDKRSLIEGETEAMLIINDEIFEDELGVSQKFYPDGYVSLLPDGALGNSHCGATPTEFDLMSNPAVSDNIAITSEGIAIQTIPIPDPVNIQTIVSACCVPSFEAMGKVHVIKGF